VDLSEVMLEERPLRRNSSKMDNVLQENPPTDKWIPSWDLDS
jgi:hypothetical protein